MIDPTWEEKLSFLVAKDQSIRDVLIQNGTLSDAYHPEMEKVHLQNAKKLAELIEKMGFPVLSNAGEKGVRFSWLIIHHAIPWPDFMRESLIQMRLASAHHDYTLELLAYTEDKVAYYEGRPQIYGTNLEWISGELKRSLILEPQKLDLRRKGIGLPPIENSPIPVTEERPPKNPVTKTKEFHEWLIKVGWRYA